MKVGIKIKSSIFLALLLLLTVGILSFLVLNGIQQYQQAQYEGLLAQQSKVANLYIRQNYLASTSPSPEEFIGRRGEELAMGLGMMSGMHTVLYDSKGKEVGNSAPMAFHIDVEDAMAYALKDQVAYQEVEDSLYYLAPIHDNNGQVGVVQFLYSLKNSKDFYVNIRNLFLTIGSGIFAVSFVLGYVFFNPLTEGIKRLRKDAQDIKRGNYLRVVPMNRRDELGELSEDIYYMGNEIAHNLSVMEEEQQKLRLAVEKLKAMEKQQKEFIGNVTHEFKTPLTTIKAYVDLLEMYSDDPRLLEEGRASIGQEAQRLYEMVEKALNLTALERYSFEGEEEKVNLAQLLEDLCQRLSGKARKFGLTMETNLKDVYVWADKEKLSQVFINLLDNAIKYNVPQGRIFVSSSIRDGRAYVEVGDTGIGIPTEARDKILEPFYRVDKDRSRQTGGTGLGLALVERIVKEMKGDISIAHGDGGGTVFAITLPLAS